MINKGLLQVKTSEDKVYNIQCKFNRFGEVEAKCFYFKNEKAYINQDVSVIYLPLFKEQEAPIIKNCYKSKLFYSKEDALEFKPEKPYA